MKTIVHIPGMTPAEDKLRELLNVYPEGGQRERSFGVWLDQEDPRIPRILDCLHKLGYQQWDGQSDRDFSREYKLSLIREYAPPDFEQVEYLEFRPEVLDVIHSSERDEQGRLRLQRPTIKNARVTGLDFASVTMGEPVVLQRVRDFLLEGGFRHLIFKPTVLVTGRGLYAQRIVPIPWEQFKVTQPWWELTSDLVLPPLSPTIDLRKWENGERFRPTDRIARCHIKEGFYNHAELHYQRSALAKLVQFDVAQTYENFGKQNCATYSVIVSKRFYDYCQQNGLKGRWAPVRVDE